MKYAPEQITAIVGFVNDLVYQVTVIFLTKN